MAGEPTVRMPATPWSYRLVCRAFIGFPWPMNAAGIVWGVLVMAPHISGLDETGPTSSEGIVAGSLAPDAASGPTVVSMAISTATEGWKVGALASSTGLTVRALHHYDHIGLLSPSHRNSAGHRLYTADDVTRLYRISLLRRLGFPLAQIGRVLDDPDWEVAATIARHLADTQRRAAITAVSLRDRLSTLAAELARHDNLSPAGFRGPGGDDHARLNGPRHYCPTGLRRPALPMNTSFGCSD